MKQLAIKNKIATTVGKATLKLKKHSPEILIVAGICGVVGSAVMACVATTKISEILDKAKDDIDEIHNGAETGEIKGHAYSEEDAKKDLTITYIQTGIKFARLYAPSVILGTLSITSIVASNNILRKRNVALAAAYATVDKGFKEYRNRVVERFGEEIDKELKHGVKTQTIIETATDENGKETNVEKKVFISEHGDLSEYARYFDKSCFGWEENNDYNMMVLRSKLNYFNDALKARKHLFLNEVYDELGMERSPAGAVVGWIYDPEDEDRDNYVDMEIIEGKRAIETPDGEKFEDVIIIDFNVDGVVYDLI